MVFLLKQQCKSSTSIQTDASTAYTNKEILRYSVLDKNCMNNKSDGDCLNGDTDKCKNQNSKCVKIRLMEKKSSPQQLFLCDSVEDYSRKLVSLQPNRGIISISKTLACLIWCCFWLMLSSCMSDSPWFGSSILFQKNILPNYTGNNRSILRRKRSHNNKNWHVNSIFVWINLPIASGRTSSSAVSSHPYKNEGVSTRKGTRTTGAGSHKKHRSIFYSSSLTKGSNSYHNNKKRVAKKDVDFSFNDNNPMKNRLFVKWVPSQNKLCFKLFPKHLKKGKGMNETIVVLSTTANKNNHDTTPGNQFFINNQFRADIIPIKNEENQKLKLSKTNDKSDQKKLKKKRKMKELSRKVQSIEDDEGWIPLEGIYGVYILPSGPHLVVITESEHVYTSGNSSSSEPFLQIRRIKSMEIVPLTATNTADDHTNNSTTQIPITVQKSQGRQLYLLRKSFREHDLYFSVPNNNYNCTDSMSIPDMTHSLQRIFSHWSISTGKNHGSSVWWKSLIPSSTPTDSMVDGKSPDPTLNITSFSSSNQPINKDNHNISTVTSGNKQTMLSPDSRFFWNEDTIQPFLQSYVSTANNEMIEMKSHNIRRNNSTAIERKNDDENPFALLLDHIIPVTSAFVGVQKNISFSSPKQENIGDYTYDELLISRRSKYRTGTRFTRRGSDETGDVANYAETEQILFVKKKQQLVEQLQEIYSHVQTRGSIPLRWASPTDVKTYRPRVLIGIDPLAQARALRSHLIEQLSIYCHNNRGHGKYSNSPQDVSTTLVREIENLSKSVNRKTSARLAFINLIDKHSDQGRLGRAFDSVLNAVLDVHSLTSSNANKFQDLPSDSHNDSDNYQSRKVCNSDFLVRHEDVKHVWFDFHAECKGGRWDRLTKLLDQVSPFLDSHGYFAAVTCPQGGRWKIVSKQNGVVRTNCMDCLDRTNVVQSVFARHILFQQIRDRPGLKYYESVTKSSRNKNSIEKQTDNTSTIRNNNRRVLPLEFVVGFKRQPLKLPWISGETAHRLLWADNADAISRLYAGTPALKGDFTRTGKRTKKGALNDGMNSLQRYYLNNFKDADRQEGMDLLVGHRYFSYTAEDDLEDYLSKDIFFESNDKISLQEATRALLISVNANRKEMDKLSFTRIKQKKRKNLNREKQSRIGRKAENAALRLKLEWLSGDLQSHMMSAADSLMNNSGDRISRTASALNDIDRRGASDDPWWVVSDEKSISNTLTDDSQDTNNMAPISPSTTFTTGGHVFGSLIAIMQAPVTSALAVICYLLPGMFLKDQKHQSTDDKGGLD